MGFHRTAVLKLTHLRSVKLFYPLRSLMPTILLLSQFLGAVSKGAIDDHASCKVGSPQAIEAFPSEGVLVNDPRFSERAAKDLTYLLSLDPDRLLANFYTNAGLSTDVLPYGGWEAPDSEVRGGFIGHYLSAMALAFANSRDPVVQKKIEYVVGKLESIQDKLGESGYLAAFPENFFERVEQGRPVWAPWYTEHKILAGLKDASALAECSRAKKVFLRTAKWAATRVLRLDETGRRNLLWNEFGGMGEMMADAYGMTREKSFLEAAELWNDFALLKPLTEGTDKLAGMHVNTQIPKILSSLRISQLNGDDSLRRAAGTFWRMVTAHHSFANGGNSNYEHFFAADSTTGHLSGANCETCTSYNMLKLTERLYRLTPDGSFFDFYERALYNHILGTIGPDLGTYSYYTGLEPGSKKAYSTPHDSFWCCVGTGVENHQLYGRGIYYRGFRSLYINLFISSELISSSKDLHVSQIARFPENNRVEIKLDTVSEALETVYVRKPAYITDAAEISINGVRVHDVQVTQGYYSLQRRWQNGDKLEISFPMKLRFETAPGNNQIGSFFYGPMLLVGTSDKREEKTAESGTAEAGLPSIVDEGDLLSGIARSDPARLEFSFPDKSTDPHFMLRPFHDVPTEAYDVYWMKGSAPEIASYRKHQSEDATYSSREARNTVDRFIVGDLESEAKHAAILKNCSSGKDWGWTWRQVSDPGVLEFKMKVDPREPNGISVALWGGYFTDSFDIFVGERRLATITPPVPTEFKQLKFQFALPVEWTRAAEEIAVRFVPHEGKKTAKILSCSTLILK